MPWPKTAVGRSSAKAPWPLKPKTGGDCPVCQAEQGAYVDEGDQAILPRSWREGRSRRGRKKEIATAGYACVCYGIMDQAIYALVADGTHGKEALWVEQTVPRQREGKQCACRYRSRTPAMDGHGGH
jgi:bacterioferritin-associated ferredoxin